MIRKYVNESPFAGEVGLLKGLAIKIVNDVLILAVQMHGSKREMIMALDIESQKKAKVAGLGRYAGTGVEVFKLNDQETNIKAFGINLTRTK